MTPHPGGCAWALLPDLFMRRLRSYRGGAGVDQAAAALRAAGYEVVEVPDPYLGAPIDGFEVFRRTFSALATRLPEAEYSPMVSWIRAQGHQVLHRTRPALTHRQRMSLPALIRKRWPVAAVITPTLAADPPPVGYFAQIAPGGEVLQHKLSGRPGYRYGISLDGPVFRCRWPLLLVSWPPVSILGRCTVVTGSCLILLP